LFSIHVGLRVFGGVARRVRRARDIGAVLRAAHDHAVRVSTVDVRGGVRRRATAPVDERYRAGAGAGRRRNQRYGYRDENPQSDDDILVQRLQPVGRARFPPPQVRRVHRRAAQHGQADGSDHQVARFHRGQNVPADPGQVPVMIFRPGRRPGQRVLFVHRVRGCQQQGRRPLVCGTRFQQHGLFQRRHAVHPVCVHVALPFPGHQQRARDVCVHMEFQTWVSVVTNY